MGYPKRFMFLKPSRDTPWPDEQNWPICNFCLALIQMALYFSLGDMNTCMFNDESTFTATFYDLCALYISRRLQL